MIIVFIGPPFSGKETQTNLLSNKLNIPVFSMGNLIRKAYKEKNKKIIKAYEEYSMKGKHLPILLKFDLLKKEIDKADNNFILDNFPANKEDLITFEIYLKERNLSIHKVFYLNILEDEMRKRFTIRGRKDDDFEVVKKRRDIQDRERTFVINYFKEMGILVEVNGKGDIEEIQEKIFLELNSSK
ncbi:MAG TPA: nucleoside monophosphate kinase [Patescibacteria group bacterium]|nr:nucleoside monophosphate kinase [Patescibacteria group bacterium]